MYISPLDGGGSKKTPQQEITGLIPARERRFFSRMPENRKSLCQRKHAAPNKVVPLQLTACLSLSITINNRNRFLCVEVKCWNRLPSCSALLANGVETSVKNQNSRGWVTTAHYGPAAWQHDRCKVRPRDRNQGTEVFSGSGEPHWNPLSTRLCCEKFPQHMLSVYCKLRQTLESRWEPKRYVENGSGKGWSTKDRSSPARALRGSVIQRSRTGTRECWHGKNCFIGAVNKKPRSGQTVTLPPTSPD